MADPRVDNSVCAYIERIDARYRRLFDQVRGLILAAFPAATVTICYQMPAYRAGRR